VQVVCAVRSSLRVWQAALLVVQISRKTLEKIVSLPFAIAKLHIFEIVSRAILSEDKQHTLFKGQFTHK